MLRPGPNLANGQLFNGYPDPYYGTDGTGAVYGFHTGGVLGKLFGEVLEGLDTDAQRALQFVRSTPGVAVALVGMKTVAHVEENLALLERPAASPEFLGKLFEPPAVAPA